MEGNYIIVDFNGTTHVLILTKTKEFLESVKPKDCPFYDYSMFNLLSDWIQMYSWQMERNKRIPLVEFVKEIRTDGTQIYKDSMINILEL
jgi:hypothetical protein